MVKWEYKYAVLPVQVRTEDSIEAVEKYLNDLGEQGWEFCQAGNTGPYAIFKRPAVEVAVKQVKGDVEAADNLEL